MTPEEITALKIELAAANRRAARLEAKVEKLQTEVKELKAERTDLKRQLRKADTDNKFLKIGMHAMGEIFLGGPSGQADR